MTFGEAVSKCLRKGTTFKGRAGKREYWWFYLATFLVYWPLLLSHTTTDPVFRLLQFLYFVLALVVFIPSLAVFTRRMHDSGRSGWNLLWALLPIVGFFILLRFTLAKGDEGTNEYGDPDNAPFTPANIKTKGEPKPQESEESKEGKVPADV